MIPSLNYYSEKLKKDSHVSAEVSAYVLLYLKRLEVV